MKQWKVTIIVDVESDSEITSNEIVEAVNFELEGKDVDSHGSLGATNITITEAIHAEEYKNKEVAVQSSSRRRAKEWRPRKRK